MTLRFGLPLTLALVLSAPTLRGAPPEWDPVQSATGWTSYDRDGSSTFYNLATRRLITWSADSGILGGVDLARIEVVPEKWVLDSLSNAWIVAGATLLRVDKTGKPGTSFTLPTTVSDLAWDTTSFVLAYRSHDLYVEKRDLKTGAVLWTYGTRPPREAPVVQNLHHVAIKEDGQVILASGTTFSVVTLDGAKGKLLGTTSFSHDGADLPPLVLGQQDRGNLVWWLGTNVALTTVPAAQVPTLKLEGLLLVKLDFAKHTVTFLPTGLAPGNALVGMLEKTAVFRTPTSGLKYVAVD